MSRTEVEPVEMTREASKSGYYLMYRGWMENPAFAKEPFTQREAWLWLIERAAFKPVRERVGSTIVDVGRGQIAASVRYLAVRFKWSKSRVERFLKTLENQDMIETASETGCTVITICNYDVYQSPRDSGGTAVNANPGQERDSSETKKKEVKELNTGNKVIGACAPTTKGSRLKEETLPDDWRQFATSEGHRSPDREFQKFRDYWIAQPGQKGVKTDWPGTWRNWVRKAVDDGRQSASQPTRPEFNHEGKRYAGRIML